MPTHDKDLLDRRRDHLGRLLFPGIKSPFRASGSSPWRSGSPCLGSSSCKSRARFRRRLQINRAMAAAPRLGLPWGSPPPANRGCLRRRAGIRSRVSLIMRGTTPRVRVADYWPVCTLVGHARRLSPASDCRSDRRRGLSQFSRRRSLPVAVRRSLIVQRGATPLGQLRGVNDRVPICYNRGAVSNGIPFTTPSGESSCKPGSTNPLHTPGAIF